MRMSAWSVLFASSLYLHVAASAQGACAAADGPNGSELCITLRLQDGRLAADRSQTMLELSPTFTRRSRITPAAARTQILSDLDALLAGFPPLVWYGFTEAERAMEAAGQITDVRTGELRKFDGSWRDFRAKYSAWQAENSQREADGPLLSTFLSSAQEERPNVDWGPLTLEDQDQVPDVIDAARGRIRMRIADPIDRWDGTNYRVALDGALEERIDSDDVIAILRPFEGSLWRPSLIRERITEFLVRRGFNPVIEVSPAFAVPKTVTVRPVERIARVVFLPPSNDTTAIEQALYLLLSQAQFNKFVARKTALVAVPGPPPSRQLDLQSVDVPLGDEPVLNTTTLEVQKLELGMLGFSLDVQPSKARPTLTEPYVDFRVERQSAETSADATRTAPQPAALATGSVVRATPADITGGSARSTLPRDETPPPPKDRKNYIAGGVEYRPEQGVRPIAFYQRSRLLGTGGLSLQAGGVNDNAIGAASVFADFLGFPTLHRRLSVQASYGSEFALRRQFNNEQADERRTGTTGRAEIEVYRTSAERIVKLSAEARRTSVDLSNGVTVHDDLTTIEFGGSMLADVLQRAYPYRLQIAPFVRLGRSDDTFALYGVRASYHRLTAGTSEFDVRATAGWTTRGTPLFEWLSFGGVDTVRGFRQDDVLARAQWAVQPEVWVRLPGTGDATSGRALLLRRSFRLAFFTDVGAVSESFGPYAGFKAGPGVGARFSYGPAVLKFDWARPIGTAATRAPWGRAYFSVNTPF